MRTASTGGMPQGVGGYLLAVIRLWRPSSAAATIAWTVSAVVTVLGWLGFTLAGARLSNVLLLALALVMAYGVLVALVGGYRLQRETAGQLAMARGEGVASTTPEEGSIFKLRGNSSITFQPGSRFVGTNLPHSTLLDASDGSSAEFGEMDIRWPEKPWEERPEA